MKQKKEPKMLYTDQTSIYDVSYEEIARRQLFAGFMTGIGGAIATLLVGFIVTVVLAGVIGPRFIIMLTQLRTTLERAGFFP